MGMTDTTRIAVLVSGGGTNLQALIDAEGRRELGNGKISLVLASKPGVYALERAKNHGIKSAVLARKDYCDIAAYSKALADKLTEEEIDLVVLHHLQSCLRCRRGDPDRHLRMELTHLV